MNREEIVAKIEENYTTMLDSEEIFNHYELQVHKLRKSMNANLPILS